MKRFLKKLFSIRVSELVIIVGLVPILVFLLDNQNVNIGVTVLPPQNPVITTITVYPDLKALSIGVAGETIYNTELIWLEDIVIGKAIELTTDTGGSFVAALDDSSQWTSVGVHKVIALMEIEQDEVILLKSNLLIYSIDEQFNITLNQQSGDIKLLTDNITEEEFQGLQDKYQLTVLKPDNKILLKNRGSSYEKMSTLYPVFEWTIYVIVLLIIPYLIIKRWRRKKTEHKSFWTLGKGIYFKSAHS